MYKIKQYLRNKYIYITIIAVIISLIGSITLYKSSYADGNNNCSRGLADFNEQELPHTNEVDQQGIGVYRFSTHASVTINVMQNGNNDKMGSASGIVYDNQQGTIVTNNHAVADFIISDNDYSSVLIVVSYLNGQYKSKASLLWRDPAHDIAIIQIDKNNIANFKKNTLSGKDYFAQYNALQGQTLYAVGSPLGKFENSVTKGTVSNIHRLMYIPGEHNNNSMISAIQTDAAINPGNSGGLAMDSSCDILGMSYSGIGSSIIQDNKLDNNLHAEGSIGINFAIPIDIIKHVVESAINSNYQKNVDGAKVDFIYNDNRSALSGVVVADDSKEDPSEHLPKGSIITRVNDYNITSKQDMDIVLNCTFEQKNINVTYVNSDSFQEEHTANIILH